MYILAPFRAFTNLDSTVGLHVSRFCWVSSLNLQELVLILLLYFGAAAEIEFVSFIGNSRGGVRTFIVSASIFVPLILLCLLGFTL